MNSVSGNDIRVARNWIIIVTVILVLCLSVFPSAFHVLLLIIYIPVVIFFLFIILSSAVDEAQKRKTQLELDREREEEEKKAASEENDRKARNEALARENHIEAYHPKFGELMRIVKKFPAEIAREKYSQPFYLELADKFIFFNLDPLREDWQKSRAVFAEQTKHIPLANFVSECENLFFIPDMPFDRLYALERHINKMNVMIAPQLGKHAYGLPHETTYQNHESLDFEQYLVTPQDRFKHAYILGKTGAGKTTLLKNLITQDIARGDGVIVLSPESGLFDFVLANLPYKRIQDLILYDPSDNTPPVVSLNPIHLENPRDLAREAGAISGTLKRAMGDDLSGAMQTLLLKCAYTLLQLPDSSFQDLRALLKPNSPLRDSLPNSPHLDDITREYWRDEFDKGGHRRSAEALISRLDAFFMPPLVSTMSRASFAFSEALNASSSVFLFDYSRIYGTQQTIIGQLTLSHLLQTLLKRDGQPEADRIPYHLYIDEFQTFAEQSESAFRDLLNRARKYKMSVTLAHQVTADIPPKLLEVILGNVGTKVCMQVATTDAEFFANQMHIKSYRPRQGAEELEKLHIGEAFLLTPDPNAYHALKITIPASPMYTGNTEPHGQDYPDFLRRTSKARYGFQQDPPAPPSDPHPPTPSSSPPKDDEDDGIFT